VEAPAVEDRLSVVHGSELPAGRRWAAFAEGGALRAGVFAVSDFNADGAVTVEDYMAYVACFVGDECPRPDAADFNGDGFLDILDYDAFVEALEAGGC
jgi:hypothetical protein